MDFFDADPNIIPLVPGQTSSDDTRMIMKGANLHKKDFIRGGF